MRVPRILKGRKVDRPDVRAAVIWLRDFGHHLEIPLPHGHWGNDAVDEMRSCLCHPAAVAGGTAAAARSALNHHVHLHACVTDGVFVPAAAALARDASPTFLPARPMTQVHLATLTERVRRRVVRWFRMQQLLDADAAADMLARENSGFSVDASVRITLIDRDMPSYFRSLEHLLRYCARWACRRRARPGRLLRHECQSPLTRHLTEKPGPS